MKFALSLTAGLLPLLAAAQSFTQQTVLDFTSRDVPAAPALDASVPASMPDEFGTAQAGYLATADFTDVFRVQSWGKTGSAVPMINSRSNVYVAANPDGSTAAATSKLVLRTHRTASGQTAAELESVASYTYASVRVMARVSGAAGACAGFFSFFSDEQEVDIEILTRQAGNRINYTNQPGSDAGATTEFDLDTAASASKSKSKFRREMARAMKRNNISWNDWHEHRFDWTEGKTSFYIDGTHLMDITVNVPTSASKIVLNMWSDGGEWSGTMAEGETAQIDIESIEIHHT